MFVFESLMASIVSSIIFTLPHLINQPTHVELRSIFLGGLLLASMVIKSRSLGTAVGFHSKGGGLA